MLHDDILCSVMSGHSPSSSWGISSSWGFSSDSGGTSCNDKESDAPLHEYKISIKFQRDLLSHINNENCYLVTIKSDYNVTAVRSIISLLWDSMNLYCYSLSVALQADPTKSRHIILFTKLHKSQKKIQDLVKQKLGFTISVSRYSTSTDTLKNDDEKNNLMTLLGSMNHVENSILQHIYTVLMMSREWFVFSEEEEIHFTGGVVAKFHDKSSSRINNAAEDDGESECGSIMENLDVCKIKALSIDWVANFILLTIAVSSFNIAPAGSCDVSEGATLNCICTGEVLSVTTHCQDPTTLQYVSSDGETLPRKRKRSLNSQDVYKQAASSVFHVGKDHQNRQNYMAEPFNSFLSALDIANRRRDYCTYLPTSLVEFVDFYKYHYGFDIHTVGGNAKITVDTQCNAVESGFDVDLIMDINFDMCDSSLTCRDNSTKSHDSKSEIPEQIAVALLMSPSGPSVCPLALLASR